jgi:hypothetical protein
MPTFDITAPDGKTYEIEGANAEGALAALQKHLGGAQPQRGVIDTFTGLDGGERKQLWPERLARGVASSLASGATLPGDVAQGKTSVQPEKPGEWSEIDEFRQNAMDAKVGGRVMDMAAFGTPVNPAVRAGDRAIPGMAKAVAEKPAVVPTTKELAEAGGADIKAARGSGLDVTASSVADYSRKVQQELFDGGVHPVDAPGTFTKLKALEDAPPDAIFTASNLQSLRESLQATAQNFNPQAAKDQLAASRAIKAIDQFLPTIAEKDVLAGSPAKTAALFERGRGDYAAAQRSNDITGNLDRARTGILERSEGRATAANSGRNMDNTLRQKTEAVLEKPKEISGYNDAEIAALERVVEGGPGRNLARNIGNKLGGGGGAAQTLFAGAGAGAGAAVGGIPGALMGAAAPTMVGGGARSIANLLAKKDMRAVDELLRKRSPLYEERLANPETYVISPEKRAVLARMLLMERMNQQ